MGMMGVSWIDGCDGCDGCVIEYMAVGQNLVALVHQGK